ncbi:TPA: hypothetical protein ROC76_004484 [Escherichia coli]|nr:hypothetical protein [Salmonella enterica]EDR5491538.1 hypothetical protein [Salmonella enterica subsp. enterica serovar 9,12:-:1,5]EET3371314.1 hypothetical protein [Escherichia coli]EJJ9008111.1 hypothetical protein [Salmonella enterica]EJX5945119.1 hypothetical protein [Salmonella enterica]
MLESYNKTDETVSVDDIKNNAFYFITLFCTFIFALVRGATSIDDSFAFGILRWGCAFVIILGVAYFGAKLIESFLIYFKHKGERNE